MRHGGLNPRVNSGVVSTRVMRGRLSCQMSRTQRGRIQAVSRLTLWRSSRVAEQARGGVLGRERDTTYAAVLRLAVHTLARGVTQEAITTPSFAQESPQRVGTQPRGHTVAKTGCSACTAGKTPGKRTVGLLHYAGTV